MLRGERCVSGEDCQYGVVEMTDNCQQTHTSKMYPMLEESRPPDHICFQGVVNLWNELEGQSLVPIIR